MTWTRTSEDAIESAHWLIRRCGWLGGTVYRLFRAGKLVALCPSAAKAQQIAEASARGE